MLEDPCTDSICLYTITWLPNGEIVPDGKGLLQIRENKLNVLKSHRLDEVSLLAKRDSCCCVKPYSADQVAASKVKSNNEMYFLLYKLDILDRVKTLLHFKSDRISDFGISRHQIAVAKPNAKVLTVYNLEGFQENEISLNDMDCPQVCQVSSDEQHNVILVCDFHASLIRKYSISGGLSVWACEDLPLPTAICEGVFGELYVSTWGGCIYRIDLNTGDYT